MHVNLQGHSFSFEDTNQGETSCRAIVDIGLLDVEAEHIRPVDKNLKIVGSSSVMMVIDLGENSEQRNIGDQIAFNLDYMGILRIMNCDYVEKRIN
jgi:predicted amino acid racemase